ncbi:MAG: hypothetical protein DLM52_09135 [Chthoniobacterales bacterium]|nr:MAG: hypothetical protein DLM52_09135 [Chthoniobacterales bacterium]
MTACRSERDRPPETSAIYQGQPVAVLPPEAPPPINAAPPRDHAVPSPPPERPSQTETAPPPPPPSATPRSTPHVVVNSENAPQFPVAKPVPGKAGFVYSPFESNGTMIDVTGYASGTKVKDPGTNRIFIVP